MARSGCEHKSHTVSVIYKGDIMTRRCDNCRMLFGPFYVYDYRWRKPLGESK